MSPDLRNHLLSESARYCAAKGISEARLATLVANDGKFFTRVRAGGGFTVNTYEKFMRYFERAA